MRCIRSAFGAVVTLACTPAIAQEQARRPAGPELAVGILQHDANFHPLADKLFFPELPPGYVYAGDESGTADVQLVYRTAPLRWLLKPRLAGKLQLNTGGRTSFASLGAEWRQHAFAGRVYAQAGIGVTIHNGYRFTPDPLAPGLTAAEASRRFDIYLDRIGFGSRVLFNPNASLGLRLSHRYAVEVAWEHFSHRQLFNVQNPGIDNVGIRLVRALGK